MLCSMTLVGLPLSTKIHGSHVTINTEEITMLEEVWDAYKMIQTFDVEERVETWKQNPWGVTSTTLPRLQIGLLRNIIIST